MGWAWIAFGAVVLGFGCDALRHIVVRRPSGREVAEALHGPGSSDLSPAFEDMVRTRWMIQGSSLAQLLAVVFVIVGFLSILGGTLLL